MSPSPDFHKHLRWNVILFGLAQLVIAIICLVWLITALTPGRTGAINITAGTWAALALGLFCLGLAQINIVGPLREHFTQGNSQHLALPFRLEPQFGGSALAYPMLSLAIAFALPIIPLSLLLVTPDDGWIGELNLIWIGLTLVCVLITAATGYLGLQRLYQRFNASEVIVEASKAEVSPGETFKVLVQYTPGRLPVEAIGLRLVCEESKLEAKWVTNNGQRHLSRTVENSLRYSAELQPPESLRVSMPTVWQKSLSVTVPPEASGTTPTEATLSITWSIEVNLNIHNAPDIKERFPFTVIVPEIHEEPSKENQETFK